MRTFVRGIIKERDKMKSNQKIRDDASEVRHGYWKDYSECSVCGYFKSLFLPFAYCPICGTKMDAEHELFLCDPEKNNKCLKQSCFINGGPCRLTTRENFKKEDKDEHPNN